MSKGGGAPGVPPIQVQTPPTWLAGYGPAGHGATTGLQHKLSGKRTFVEAGYLLTVEFEFQFEWGFYGQAASKAIFRVRG